MVEAYVVALVGFFGSAFGVLAGGALTLYGDYRRRREERRAHHQKRLLDAYVELIGGVETLRGAQSATAPPVIKSIMTGEVELAYQQLKSLSDAAKSCITAARKAYLLETDSRLTSLLAEVSSEAVVVWEKMAHAMTQLVLMRNRGVVPPGDNSEEGILKAWDSFYKLDRSVGELLNRLAETHRFSGPRARHLKKP